jgi:ubiquitin
MKKQIDVALSELKKDCSDRVAAINAIKGRKIKEKKERQLQSEAAKAKLKRKEEAKAKLKRSQLREEASCRANDLEGGSIEDTTPPRVNDIARRQERNGKGSNFFDPRSDDKTGDLNV